MNLDDTKFNIRSLSTLIFIPENKKIFKKKIGYQRHPEAIKSQPP